MLKPKGRMALSTPGTTFRTPAQELSLAALARLAEDDGLQVPRVPEHHDQLGDAELLVELLEEFGFRDVKSTQMVTGFRASNPWEWIDLLGGLSPFAHSVVASMGGVRRARLAAALAPLMSELGDDAWRLHQSFTLAVAWRG